MIPYHKVIVIGAGVSGLVTLKTLKQLGVSCTVYEANDYHGGLWHFNPDTYGVMEFTHINVCRHNYAFSDFPFPEEGPEFAHHSAISDYIDSYVEHFDLADNIHYKTRVVQVAKAAETDINEISSESSKVNWIVTCESGGRQFTNACEYLVVATGHHAKPKIPKFPGEDTFEGNIIHSVKYKDVLRSGFQGKNVVIIGIGNSSVDIADDLVTRGKFMIRGRGTPTESLAITNGLQPNYECNAIIDFSIRSRCPEVHISSRSGTWIFPNYWFGSPSDLTLSRLGSGIPPAIGNAVMKVVLTALLGHPTKWGLNPKYGPVDTHPTVSPTLIHHIQRGRVRIAPNIKEIGPDSVTFEDGSTASDVGAIIKCTGYTIDLPYLTDDVKRLVLDEEANDLNMFHTVFNPDIGRSLALIGYIQPIGGLIPMSEIQAQWLGMIITGQCSLPPKAEMEQKIAKDRAGQSHYNKSTRHTIQRQVIPYCDEIASHFGAKPRAKDYPRLAYSLLFGTGGPAQWTLQGPYYNPEAAKIVRKVPVPPFNVIMNILLPMILLSVLYVLLKLVLFAF